MRKGFRSFVLWLAVICAFPVLATELPPSIKGDLIAYHQNRLPNPIVVYAYDDKGTLLDVFGRHGDNGFATRDRVRDLIRAGTIPAAGDQDLADIDQSFRQWLADTGVAFDRVVDPDKAYSLVLAVPDAGAQPCPPCAQYANTLGRAVRAPAAQGRFSLHVLSLGSSMLKFQTVH